MITLAGELKGIKQLVDGSLTIPIHTQELSPEKMAAIFTMSKFCYIGLKPEAFTAKELSDLDNMKSDASFGQTLSKRMRNTLYVVYKKSNIDESFENYYSRRMSDLIELIKDEIDE